MEEGTAYDDTFISLQICKKKEFHKFEGWDILILEILN